MHVYFIALLYIKGLNGIEAWNPMTQKKIFRFQSTTYILQVNHHDQFFDEQGLFTFKNKWLLVLNNDTDLLNIQQYAGDIIHLTAVVLHLNITV